MTTPKPVAGTPLFVADNLALDFINTQYGIGAKHCDCLADDQCVLAWLEAAGQLPQQIHQAPKGLLALARQLREAAKLLVEAAKAGRAGDTGVINRVLELGRPISELQWDGDSASFKVVRRQRDADAASLLEPVAQALVTLLTKEQLALVRQCEADDCTLLFHDLTKSHRRRWCSMAGCGNRMKVAAFRSRQKAGPLDPT